MRLSTASFHERRLASKLPFSLSLSFTDNQRDMSKSMKPTDPTTAQSPVSPVGEAVRRRLLGDDTYEAMLRNTTGLDREYQLYITNQIFGRTWARGILSEQQLSLVNLSMLAGKARMEEWELHFRIAITVTKVPLIQLRELILHIGLYCGIPIARDCMAIARKVLKEEKVDLSVLDDEEQA